MPDLNCKWIKYQRVIFSRTIAFGLRIIQLGSGIKTNFHFHSACIFFDPRFFSLCTWKTYSECKVNCQVFHAKLQVCIRVTCSIASRHELRMYSACIFLVNFPRWKIKTTTKREYIFIEKHLFGNWIKRSWSSPNLNDQRIRKKGLKLDILLIYLFYTWFLNLQLINTKFRCISSEWPVLSWSPLLCN